MDSEGGGAFLVRSNLHTSSSNRAFRAPNYLLLSLLSLTLGTLDRSPDFVPQELAGPMLQVTREDTVKCAGKVAEALTRLPPGDLPS